VDEATRGARDFSGSMEDKIFKEDHASLNRLLQKLGQDPVPFVKRNWNDSQAIDFPFEKEWY
jgi:hypothetical protein